VTRRAGKNFEAISLFKLAANHIIRGSILPKSQTQTMTELSFATLANVLHPSDFSPESEIAFAHALKFSLAAQSKLTLIHVATEDKEDWNQFPGVRQMLERWKLLPENSHRSAVPELGIDVRKVMAHSAHPAYAVLKYQAEHQADLIVMAAHERHGVESWFHEGMSEPVARKSGAMTLFLPEGKKGFVSENDGSVALEKILIPIAQSPDPAPALDNAAKLVEKLGLKSGTFTLLHVGKAEEAPQIQAPEVSGWTWTQVAREGDVIECIAGAATGLGADLIVMSTDGPDNFLDTFRGSHSERVLRTGACPLLTVPAK